MILETVEHETASNPQWTILLLHGLGADGHDFSPLVPELVRPGWPALRVVFPHAPMRAVTINNGIRMRAWYDVRDFGTDELTGGERADSAGVLASVAQVEALIARETERGVPPQRLILAGFSQGGAVTLATGLRRDTPLAGLVALSAYLPMAARAAVDLHPGANLQPVFMGHGREDPAVPCVAGEFTASVLRDLGFSVDWHRYPMPHSVCPEEIRDLGAWLGRRLTQG